MRSNEAQRESRKKDKLERELKQSKADLDAKNSEIKALNQTMEKLKGTNASLEQNLKEQRVSNIITTESLTAQIMRAYKY